MKKEVTPGLASHTFKRRRQLEKDLDHITEEMYRRNKELTDINQVLSLLRAIDSLVLQSHEQLDELCQQITEAIIDNSRYLLVGLLANPPRRRHLSLYGWKTSNGVLAGTEPFKLMIDTQERWLSGPEKILTVDLNHLSTKHLAKILTISEAEAEHLRGSIPAQSIALVKLFARNRLVGLLVVGFSQPAAEIADKDRLLLDRLSETVGIALDNKLLFEENQEVLRQLRRSNEKLQALDETKDDFISMASHQLRTPLTSVKGYLSMVLEGDAGKVNETQKKMLGQAFVSSQRMVFLIADLLNVSRLKTGKFVIEATPTDLSEMVSEELDQLVETAAAREIKLSYDKPKDFPVLMLDETKTRQVIMNFVDNAIYYTPAGGHIRVELEEKPTSVELKVIDDGIGVPKAEQHHLFTKFYRAGNARKARPDGTGLGLYMAKKVIMVQGGSILFESREGQGSTFGFLFPKDKAHTAANTPKIPVKTAKPLPHATAKHPKS